MIEIRAGDPLQFGVADILFKNKKSSIDRISVEILEGSPDFGTVIGVGCSQGDRGAIP
jgi:hypothetical protein